MLQSIISIFILGLFLNAQAQPITITLNQHQVTQGDLLELAVVVDAPAITTTEADVYLAVQFPDATLYYFDTLNSVSDINHVVPLVTAWPVHTLSQTTLLAFQIPAGLPNGVYKWYLTLVPVGQDVTQPHHWIAQSQAEVTLVGDSDDDAEAERADSVTTATSPPTSMVAATLPTWSEHGGIDDKVIQPQSGVLTAGDIDDNLNFSAFHTYLDRLYQAENQLPVVDISQRVTLKVQDHKNNAINQARIQLTSMDGQQQFMDLLTATNGHFYLFPKVDGLEASSVQLHLSSPEDTLATPQTTITKTLDFKLLSSEETLSFTLEATPLSTTLELMLVIDTTGSMSDELRYLTTELRDIISTVHEHHPQVSMRFGLVVYRDEGDDYVVNAFEFTDSLNRMQLQLSEQHAQGGGDYPEAMEQALATALTAQWQIQSSVTRLLFLVADAPPHDADLVTMINQIKKARQSGIHIYPLAASGVAETAEWILRLAALLTQGRYLFLTDDSGIGYAHQQPQIPCYQVTHLDELMARVIASELAGKRLEAEPNAIIRTVGDYQAGKCQ